MGGEPSRRSGNFRLGGKLHYFSPFRPRALEEHQSLTRRIEWICINGYKLEQSLILVWSVRRRRYASRFCVATHIAGPGAPSKSDRRRSAVPPSTQKQTPSVGSDGPLRN